jgi:hypothetical protein
MHTNQQERLMKLKAFKIALVIFLPAIAAAQTAAQTSSEHPLTLRTIQIIPVSTSPIGLPDLGSNAFDALAKIGVQVETRLDAAALARAIPKAEQAVQSVYASAGRSVRVEHEVVQGRPRNSIALRFRVIELRSSDRPR